MYEENLSSINATSTATDHIRLLRPSRTNQQLWRLKVFSLQKAPPFAALSYSWGERKADAHISIDTGSNIIECPISEDLSCAIARLGETNKQQRTDSHVKTKRKLRWLWIDAICIDQASNSEKSHQVAMMRTIYSAAKHVYVWLGEETASAASEAEYPNSTDLREYLIAAGINKSKIRLWILEERHVWWERLWVIQEVVACQTVFICIGPHWTLWDHFWGLLGSYLRSERDAIASQDIMANMVDAMDQQVLRTTSLRSNLQSKPDGESIFKLLRTTSGTGVSNPHDRIYSLLGVASTKDRQNIPVDYGMLLMEVFSAVVQYRIKTQDNLDILFEGWCGGNGILRKVSVADRRVEYRMMSQLPRGIGNALPTWLPDFTKPLRTKPCPWLEFHRYNASLNTQPKIKVHFQSQILGLGSVHFDTILHTSRKFLDDDIHRGFSREIGAGDARHDLVPPEDASYIWDLIGPGRYLSSKIFFFRTGRGFLGLSMEQPREGDEIIVPFGLSTPAIVRRAPVDNFLEATGSLLYTLVGDCYVHGIMNGELMAIYNEEKIGSETHHLI